MSKQKIIYFCQECGYESPKWLGRCSGCGAWNTLVEEPTSTSAAKKGVAAAGLSSGQAPMLIADIATDDAPRFSTGSPELDRVLGNGTIPGSLVLIVGDPGVGKSSLTIRVCAHVAKSYGRVLYVTGEESSRQVKLRASRLGAVADNLYVLSETNLDVIEKHILAINPSFLVIDSIQTVFRPEIPSAPGSVSQIRESAVQLLRIAKGQSIATFIVGHVTKDGVLAGPRVLEHIVDTVLYFEGERNAQFRILRAVKNRFGSTNEIGLFEMRGEGLIDIPDASKLFISEQVLDVPGNIIVSSIEGTRPLLVEMQALVSPSPFTPPRRTADYVDIKRIQLLLAVLEKRVGMLLGNCDVYVKIAGGIKVDEPAVDLGLIYAIASSFRDRTIIQGTVVFGEVGLAGEVRAVTQSEARIKEAEKLGFKRIILPRGNLKKISWKPSIELIGIDNVADGLDVVFD